MVKEIIYRFKIVGTWLQWDIKLPMDCRYWKFWSYFLFFGQITSWAISQDILRGPRLFWLLKISLETAHKVFCPQKKISCTFKIRNTCLFNQKVSFQDTMKRNTYNKWSMCIISHLKSVIIFLHLNHCNIFVFLLFVTIKKTKK